MNENGACRKAPATPGLLITKYIEKFTEACINNIIQHGTCCYSIQIISRVVGFAIYKITNNSKRKYKVKNVIWDLNGGGTKYRFSSIIDFLNLFKA